MDAPGKCVICEAPLPEYYPYDECPVCRRDRYDGEAHNPEAS